MPHTTFAYPFEAMVGEFAGNICRQFRADPTMRSFLLRLDRNGNVLSLTFEDGSATWDEQIRNVQTSEDPHIFYDPLEDGMEYIWLSWHAIEQSTMERVIGRRFQEGDFTPIELYLLRARKLESDGRYPSSWGVMF